MTFELLPNAIQRLREQIPEKVAQATNEVAIVILRTASVNTPVDTSKAMSNWQIGLGAKPASYLEAHIEGVGGDTQFESLAVVESNGRSRLKNRNVGTPIHVANNAPYIDGLDSGDISLQPGGFVRKAEVEGQRKIRSTKLEFK